TGLCVGHVAPEAVDGGPIAFVRDGDRISLDVANRTLDLLVGEAELEKRRKDWTPPPVPEVAQRGYARLYREHVQQADEGCDFDFLAAVRK
ncbi:MAG: dihydroxy-acid dehydratase, partial [Pseudorhodoplanes sp.]